MPTKTDNIRSKGVHIKMDRVTHANFKSQLAQHGLSMQEAFEEFARQVGSGVPSANNLLQRLIKSQIKQELAEVGLKPMAPRRNVRLPELDTDSVYDLISGEDDDSAIPPQRRGRDEAA